MSRLNPEDSHKGLSHPALLEILKTAAKRARDTYSSASLLMTEMSRRSFGEERGSVTYSAVLSGKLGVDKSARARLT